MFKNIGTDGRRNICGPQIAALRKEQGKSQRELADMLQLQGMDLGKNAIQKIESGERFVTDIELNAFAECFGLRADQLLHSRHLRD